MISMTFRGECPYCKEEYERTCATDTDIEGDYVDICSSCGKRFLIHWLMIIDATTMSVSDVAPPVRCDVELDYWFNDDEDDEDEGEIEA